MRRFDKLRYGIAIGLNIGCAVANLVLRNVDGCIGFALAAFWAWHARHEYLIAEKVLNASNELLNVLDEMKETQEQMALIDANEK